VLLLIIVNKIFLLIFVDMAPFYEELSHSLSWKIDQALLKKMRAANHAELKKLDEAIADAEKNLGESEIRENMLKKAEYLCSIGDKVNI
jgi:26S proteasome regulatory subunit N7